MPNLLNLHVDDRAFVVGKKLPPYKAQLTLEGAKFNFLHTHYRENSHPIPKNPSYWAQSQAQTVHPTKRASVRPIYGVVYRTISCDAFTREFLTSQGIDVGEPESLPPDPYIQNRAQREHEATVASRDPSRSLAEDKRYRFLEYDGMILTFHAIWNEDQFKLRYFLADDTIAVTEVRKPNDGKASQSSLLLKRTKVPKNWKDVPSYYPGVYMEKTDAEVREYYSPSDLKVGDTVFIFGRRFFLYDCDPFTRKYYSGMLGIEQPARVEIPEGYGTICPRPDTSDIKKPDNRIERSQDLIRKIYNFPKRLRYSVVIDVVHPEDEGREFVLEYSLSDGSIRILELERRNSGRVGGCFLGWHRVPKPNSDEFYTPEDFYIGKKLNVFGHWFIITGTEPFVYKYMLANPQKFDQKLKDNISDYLRKQGLLKDEDNCDCDCDPADRDFRPEAKDTEEKKAEKCGSDICGVDKKELQRAGGMFDC